MTAMDKTTKHIARADGGLPTPLPVCGEFAAGDTFVQAAMQSDCDACRTHPSVNCGRVGDVRWDGRGQLGVQPEVVPYTPEPWSDK